MTGAQLCTAHNGVVAPHIAPNCPKYERPDMVRLVMDQEARREAQSLNDDDLAVYVIRCRRLVLMAEEDGKTGSSSWVAERDLACLQAAEREDAMRRRAAEKGGPPVAGGGWRERVERIRTGASLLDYVIRAMPLFPRGRSWWGCCLWHEDETPSFEVRPDRGTFRCWSGGCGLAGDIFDWLQLRFGLDFAAAVRHLDPEPAPASNGGRRVLPA